MDGNNSLYSSIKSPKQTNNVLNYKLNIELGKKELKEIIIAYNSNPEELAYNFCHKNNLDYNSLKLITNKIMTIKKSQFKNSENIFKSITNKNKIKYQISFPNDQLLEEKEIYNNNIKMSEIKLNDYNNNEMSLNSINNKKYTIDNKNIGLSNNISKNISGIKKNYNESKKKDDIFMSNQSYNNKYFNNSNANKDKNLIFTTNITKDITISCFHMLSVK